MLCFWMVDCASKVNGVKSRTISMETVELEAVLILAQGHTDEINGVEVLSDGWILSYSNDGALRIWNDFDGTLLHTLEGHTGGVNGVEVLSDGRILSYSNDGTTDKTYEAIFSPSTIYTSKAKSEQVA